MPDPTLPPRPTLQRQVPIERREQIKPEPLPSALWRLVITPPQDGATNMAIDEALTLAVARGESLPILRFYQWSRPCLSLGYAQSLSSADLGQCAQRGWDVVRRSTGGRAVLHVDELTYSCIAPESDPRMAGGVLASYRRIAGGLLAGLRLLGLEPERAQPYYTDKGSAGPACFDGPSDYEITIGQAKLIGSAQKRQHNTVLQHGSLPLMGDVTGIVDALQLTLGERLALRNRLHWRATTLAYCLGQQEVDVAWVQAGLQAGLSTALQLQLEQSGLSVQTWGEVEQIKREKYGNPTWLGRIP